MSTQLLASKPPETIDLRLPQEYDAAIQALACQPNKPTLKANWPRTGFFTNQPTVVVFHANSRVND